MLLSEVAYPCAIGSFNRDVLSTVTHVLVCWSGRQWSFPRYTSRCRRLREEGVDFLCGRPAVLYVLGAYLSQQLPFGGRRQGRSLDHVGHASHQVRYIGAEFFALQLAPFLIALPPPLQPFDQADRHMPGRMRRFRQGRGFEHRLNDLIPLALTMMWCACAEEALCAITKRQRNVGSHHQILQSHRPSVRWCR